MKILKLQVGKTYRNRKGEEVKITGYDRGYYKPYKGTNGEWYTEGGRWQSFSSEENPEDLIEEVAIPDVNKKYNEMKQLKLEVGKTYKSRNGKAVKIIKNDNGGEYTYKGSDGQWYTESGRFDCQSQESPYDLIEEVPETSHTFSLVPETLSAIRYIFDIPDGMKKGTVSQEGNRIIVEIVPEEGESKPKTVKAKNECSARTSEDVKKMINLREMNKVLTRIKKVYMLKDIDVRSRLGRQVEARAIWAYYLIEVEGIQHADAAKIIERKRPMMYHYVKLVKDLYETNVPFRERFNKIGIPWRG